MVRVGGLAVNKSKIGFLKNPFQVIKRLQMLTMILKIYGNGHTKFYEEAYKAIKGDGVNISRGEDGQMLKVILAYMSRQERIRR